MPTPSDLFFGEVPTNVEKGLSQGRENKFSTEDTLQFGPYGNNTQLSVVGRGFKKVFSKVQDLVLQVYKSRQGRTNGLEVEKGKTKTKGVCVQEKPMDLQSPSIGLMEPICKAPVSQRLRSHLKLTKEHYKKIGKNDSVYDHYLSC